MHMMEVTIAPGLLQAADRQQTRPDQLCVGIRHMHHEMHDREPAVASSCAMDIETRTACWDSLLACSGWRKEGDVGEQGWSGWIAEIHSEVSRAGPRSEMFRIWGVPLVTP